MNQLLERIGKARARGAALDLDALASRSHGRSPEELTSPAQLARRRQFLSESLGDEREAKKVFERIILGNELQDANYLARGARAAEAVARIAIHEPAGRQLGWGTGFLIGPGLLITNNHVLPSAEMALRSVAQFRVELDIDGRTQPAVPFALQPEQFFHTSSALDYSVVAVQPQSQDAGLALADFGFLPLVATLGKVVEGEWLTIVQHPNGERKQVCVRENQLIKINGDVLWYSTDTLGGSSGSPVHNNDWFVVALHHSGVAKEKNGRIQTIDGRDFDPLTDSESSIKWIANEGIRVSRILADLQSQKPDHPLLRPVFSATAAASRITVPQAVSVPRGASVKPAQPPTPRPAREPAPEPAREPAREPAMTPADPSLTERTLTVTLGIRPDGSVRVLSGGADERINFPVEAASALAPKPPAFDVPFNADYADRRGFEPSFLGDGGLRVHLPVMGDALAETAAALLKPVHGNPHELRYHHYSVVMHAKRRLAIYSAANVDFSGRYQLSRPADVWRMDPRIPADAQLTNFYYRNNRFDRGHLTRREDLEYGSTRMRALVSAADTCHWTNCTPQHERFNQSKELWQGIEQYVLEQSVKDDAFRAQVITGPILAEDDPTWEMFPKIQYPVRFWKLVAAVDSKGALFATAYMLDQSAVIDQFGIREAREVPFGAYKTFQVTVAEVERETGLQFFSGPDDAPVPLSAADPMTHAPSRSGRSRPRRHEAAGLEVPQGYRPLDGFESIYLGD